MCQSFRALNIYIGPDTSEQTLDIELSTKVDFNIRVDYMWSRKLSKKMGGIDLKDFTKAFLLALKEDEVQKSLGISDLKQEITGLRQTVELFRKELHEKDQTISSLEKRISILKNEKDQLEQYSRRNSLRMT